ncbi:DUF262 domain-containing protein [Helicobacter suis]|uniref:DUF262 domain-containing protein n=1 Tax=Helicobacter suis TaxID=104628 RepID=UPI001F086C1C|nr:DUF262 domain-containing protein [Helicobacter suis]
MSYRLDMQTIQINILDYLSKNKFVIPEYQRTYEWESEQCEQLWKDITEFFGEGKYSDQNPYFLGSIVVYPVEDKNTGYIRKYVVDGQQRTTTLMLLLKAIHAKLTRENNGKIQKLLSDIASCLWNVDDLEGQPDYTKTHLTSEAAVDTKCKILQNILEGVLEQDKIQGNSNYEKNYSYFCTQLDEYAKSETTTFKEWCRYVLHSCIVLLVECGRQNEEKRLDYALRVFNTLNARGLPLSDADIFKGVIFSSSRTRNGYSCPAMERFREKKQGEKK